MFYEGRFTRSPLLVYPTFADCVTDKLPDKYDAEIAGLDWGSTNPTAFYLIGLLGADAYVHGEYYQSGQPSDEKYKHIAAACKANNVRVLYVDPAAAQVILDLQKMGCPA